MSDNVKIFRTPSDLATYFAEELIDHIRKAGGKKKPFTIALSGGSTPKLLFEILAERYSESEDWRYVHFFWGDERCVPPDDPESNFGTASLIFLSKIKIPAENIHMIRGEENPQREAARYSEEIRKFTSQTNGLPALNIIILGMGDDGHTASIFPGNLHLLESEKICETASHPVSGQQRITMTGKVINNANSVCFMVTGDSKAKIIKQIFKKEPASLNFPATHIVPMHGRAFWLLDEKAGAYLI